MLEITTEAFVLDKIDAGEYDARILLYTKDFGGVLGRATSIRKLTSKMASHLEPLTFSRVRLIQKNDGANFQIADALAYDRCLAWREDEARFREALRLLEILKETAFGGGEDQNFWAMLEEIFKNPPAGAFSSYGARVVSALGFDKTNALCGICGTGRPKVFSIKSLAFYCESCLGAYNSLS